MAGQVAHMEDIRQVEEVLAERVWQQIMQQVLVAMEPLGPEAV